MSKNQEVNDLANGIADMFVSNLNKEIEEIAQMVEEEDFCTYIMFDPELLAHIATAIRARKVPET